MKWPEVRDANIAKAVTHLATSGGELVNLVCEWIGATREVPRSTREQIAVHPATALLADAFDAAGQTDLSGYLRSFAVMEGPIHPGRWAFSVLIGRACAIELVRGLSSGQWRDDTFWGHESYGAWAIFEDEVFRILSGDDVGRENAWTVIGAIVDNVTGDPGKSARGGPDVKAGVLREIDEYRKRPSIADAWQTRLDEYVWFDAGYIFRILRRLDAPRALALAAKLPHPVFVDLGLGESSYVPQTNDPRELARLVAAAPSVFDSTETFQHSGMVAVCILDAATALMRSVSGDGASFALPLSAEDEAQLQHDVQKSLAAADVFAEAVLSRSDGVALAWVWLERLAWESDVTGLWRCRKPGMHVDAIMILVSALARRLKPRDNAIAWIGAAAGIRPIDRATAVLAVALHGDSKKMLWALLFELQPLWVGTEQKIERSDGLVGRIGGACVLATERPAEFVAQTWQQLRPHRERAWVIRANGDRRPNLGELFAMWCIFAMEQATPPVRADLFLPIAEMLKDAFHTDAQCLTGQFWPAALERFGRSAAKVCADSERSDELIADLFRPYIGAEEYGIRLATSLLDTGLDIAKLQSCLSINGVELSDLASRFLQNRKRLIARDYYNSEWIGRIRMMEAHAAK